MDSIIETLSITVSLVTLFLIPAVLLTVSYLIKRNGFYINANCWFCNGWTKVPFAERNSFYCPLCSQYNGFNEDGGYNKVIEEQFNNQHCANIRKTETNSSNGLCAYCNNNQQLKVKQLANFVPLNERNYDVEIEHFRVQLEKSYKLCKKCDKVLKRTIERQHAWIFGNRIKSLKKKSLRLLNLKSNGFNELSKTSIAMNVIRYSLILFSLIVLSQALNAKMNYPKSTMKEYLPDIFTRYTIFLNDWCHIVSNATDNLIKNVSNKFNLHLYLGNVRIENDILPITWVGLMLEIILLTRQTKSILWKTNELLGWIILTVTSLNTFHDDYFEYINAVQILCSIAVIYSVLLTGNVGNREQPKKCTFRKIKKNTENAESSDEEIYEDMLNSSICSKKSVSEQSYKTGNNYNASQRHSQNLPFPDLLQNTANVHNAFNTPRRTKSSPSSNISFKNFSTNSSSNELNRSLDNLHLSNLNNLHLKPQSCASPVFSVSPVSRPILSPPKLKNITQNSWTAGGFWKNDVAVFPGSTDVANLSRSSSQSSGFVSSNEPAVPNTYNSLPPSREPSLFSDFEKASISSEPTYHFTPINAGQDSRNVSFTYSSSHFSKPCSPKANQLYYKSDNIFYPILKQNNMLLVQRNDIPRFNFESSFSNLSLRNFNSSSGFNTPVLFGEKPVISSLFKNLQGVSPQSHTFRAPHC